MRHSLAVLAAFFVFLVAADGVLAASPELVTKGELLMALIESRIVKVPQAQNDGKFPDVPKGHQYERYLIIGEKYGIIDADPKSGKLFPDRPITRAEYLRMLAYTFGLPTSQAYLYTDVLEGDWYAEYAGLAQKYALFDPEKRGKFLRPGKMVTRREAVRGINKVLRAEGETIRKEQELSLLQATEKLGSNLPTSSTQEKAIVSVDDVKTTSKKTVTESKEIVQLRKDVLKLVNVERNKKGLGLVYESAPLDRSAQAYAQDIAILGFFSHVSPSGETLRDRVLGTGYIDLATMADCNCLLGYAFAENLASGQKTPKDVVKAWMNSEGHRENILNPLFTDLGIGIYAGIWVQHFGGILTPK